MYRVKPGCASEFMRVWRTLARYAVAEFGADKPTILRDRDDPNLFVTFGAWASARGLDKAADRAGLNPEGVQRLSFHDLRHTAITHLIRLGADAAQVSRFAGHSKVSTTLDLYVGEFEKRKVNDSGQRLAEVYAGGLPQS
jgi:integrase